jgi:hypothetical protein
MKSAIKKGGRNSVGLGDNVSEFSNFMGSVHSGTQKSKFDSIKELKAENRSRSYAKVRKDNFMNPR